ncbi:MAG TPA: BON domain-containing protein [Burkholderiales bacterium]|nr:BON domain-containing protein [Burkholderiales bacterium]
MNRTVLCGILLALWLGAAGCASEPRQEGGYLDDARITARVKKAIYDEPSLKVTQISVTTEARVVHLSGTVGTRAEVLKAAQVARAVEGVKGVKNELKLAPPAKGKSAS